MPPQAREIRRRPSAKTRAEIERLVLGFAEEFYDHVHRLRSLRGTPGLTVLFGSGVDSLMKARDLDIMAVVPGLGQRQFFSARLDGKTVEIEIVEQIAFQDHVRNVHWYPLEVVAEIGKLKSGLVLDEHPDPELMAVYETARLPSAETRLFAIAFHIGLLAYKQEAKLRGLGERYCVMENWSILSVIAACVNEYPGTMYEKRFLDRLSPASRRIARRYLGINILDDAHWSRFLNFVRDHTEALTKESTAEPVPYYPQDQLGAEILGLRTRKNSPTMSYGLR